MKKKPRTEKGWFLVNENGEPTAHFFYQRSWAVEERKAHICRESLRIVAYKVIPIVRNK